MRPSKRMRFEPKVVDDSKEISNLEQKIQLLCDVDAKDITNFKDLPISEYTIRGLKETGFIEPTKVQRQTLVHSLRGKDVVAASKTGSGKSLAFIIPMLELLYRNRWSSDDGVGALVVTPTRELAYQLFELLNIIGKHHAFSAGLIIGGKDLKYEWKTVGMLHIIICTPGRLVQHITENSLFDVNNLQILILDEADECLSMGFEKTMKVIFRSLPKSRQTLLFSATQTKNVSNLSLAGCKDAVMCFTHENSKSVTPKKLVQAFYVCKQERKMAFLWTFIMDHLMEKILVFVTTCKQARYYSDLFSKMDRKLNILMLHGGMHQLRRMAVYDEYCQKNHATMIATDVAARGLDFPSVHWVVQLDCPDSAKVYIHRVGRTARFDDEGRSVLVLTPMQKEPMLEELTVHNIKLEEVEDYPSLFENINKRIEKQLVKSIDLQEQAERVFYCYLKALSKTRKEFCDLAHIDFEAFASSLGLARTPDIRFLNRKITFLKKYQDQSQIDLLNEDVTKDNLADDNPTETLCNKQSEHNIKKAVSLDQLLTISDQQMVELAPISELNKPTKNKIITKYSIAKNINHKGIRVNSKIIFDEDGNPVTDGMEVNVPSKLSLEEFDYNDFSNKMKSEDKIDRKVHAMKCKNKKLKKKIKKNE